MTTRVTPTIARLVQALTLMAVGVSCGRGRTVPVEPVSDDLIVAVDRGAELNFPLNGLPDGTHRFAPAFPHLRFRRPVGITHAGDGTDRLFVLEQTGVIRVFPNDPSATQSKVFLDLSAKIVKVADETGLLGLAFHPDYASNGRLYVSYLEYGARPWFSVIAEYRVDPQDPDRADPNSERVVLKVEQPFNHHNGGCLAFGPDRLLYASFGDGGGADDPLGNGQDRSNLHSTLIRIDPLPNGTDPYSVPADNPFVGQSGVRPEIWAYGFRNPYRFSFDRQNGELWLGDVGSYRAEEVNVVQRGGNYGWSVFESDQSVNNPNSQPPSAFDAPLYAYPRAHGKCIIGGVVVRSTSMPTLERAYLFGDYVSANVWSLRRSSNGPFVSLVGTLPGLSSFGESESGDVFAVSIAGTIHRPVLEVGGGAAFPRQLSATGLFRDTAQLEPAPGVLAYDVIAPFWSDGADKRRWLALPEMQSVTFSAADGWQFPLGTAIVKHFELDLDRTQPGGETRLETRVFVRERDGWSGYTYLWNAQQTDADLWVSANGFERRYTVVESTGPRTQDWYFPGRADCVQCHTVASGHVLGLRTKQTNARLGGANVLHRLNSQRIFTRDIGAVQQYPSYVDPYDVNAPLEGRARTWMAVNCGSCHQPGGPTPAEIDLRERVARADMNCVDVRPRFGSLGLSNARIIRAGDKSTSTLWERLHRFDRHRMPKLGSNELDAEGAEVIGRWIDTMR